MNLQEHVVSILKDQAQEPDFNYLDLAKQVSEHGCFTGLVSEMIYYTDTCAFYEKHIKEINKLLAERMEWVECTNPVDFFGSGNWYVDDPLALGTTNQNRLAWFAFETICQQLTDENEEY